MKFEDCIQWRKTDLHENTHHLFFGEVCLGFLLKWKMSAPGEERWIVHGPNRERDARELLPFDEAKKKAEQLALNALPAGLFTD